MIFYGYTMNSNEIGKVLKLSKSGNAHLAFHGLVQVVLSAT